MTFRDEVEQLKGRTGKTVYTNTVIARGQYAQSFLRARMTSEGMPYEEHKAGFRKVIFAFAGTASQQANLKKATRRAKLS